MKNFKKIDNISRTNINILSPFKLLVLRNFPFIEADYDALTNYELMCLMNKYMNDINSNVNILNENQKGLYDTFNNVVNYINDYFENLDLQEEVNNKLDEMAESGLLADLIFKKDYNKYASLNSHRLARFIIENGNNNINTDTSTTYYGQIQGSCLINDTTIALVFSATDNTNKKNNTAKIQIISLATGNVLRENILTLGHANGITYNPNNDNLYITECYYYDSNETLIHSNKVYIVNQTNLTLEGTIELEGLDLTDNLLLNLDYDKQNNKFYAMQYFTVHELDENFTIVNTIDLSKDDIVDIGTYQTIHRHNNFYYMVNAHPNYIHVFNENGESSQHYHLNDYIEESFYLGELEDIDFDSDNNIIATSHKSLCEGSDCNVAQIFKLNTIKNQSICDTDKYIPNFRKRITISPTFTLAPDGTSAKPFNELAEAIEFALSPKGRNVHYVNMIQGTYRWCFICGMANLLRIIGNGSTIHGISSFYSNLLLQNLSIDTNSSNELGLTPLYSLYSTIYLENITWLLQENYNTLITSSISNIECYNSVPTNLDDNTTFIQQGELCKIRYRGHIKNIKSSGNYTDIGDYRITETDINLNATGANIPLNSYLQAQNITLNNLVYVQKYITFEYKDSRNRRYIKRFKTDFQTSGNRDYNIFNTEVQGNNFYVNELIVRQTNNTLSILANKTMNNNGTLEETAHLTLISVYVSQN